MLDQHSYGSQISFSLLLCKVFCGKNEFLIEGFLQQPYDSQIGDSLDLGFWWGENKSLNYATGILQKSSGSCIWRGY